MAGTCCCCVPIQCGVITIAVLGILAGLYAVIDGILFIATYRNRDNSDLVTSYKRLGYSPTIAVLKTRETLKFQLGLSIFFVILGVIHIIACVVLLVGVTGRKPKLVKVWVLVGIGTLSIFALGLVITGIIAISYKVGIIAIFPVGFFLVVAVPWAGYHIYVVHQYASTDENNSKVQPTPQAYYQAEPPKEPPNARPPTEEEKASICCCCVPIRVGVIIIAILGIIGGLLIFADGIYVFATYKTYNKQMVNAYANSRSSGYGRQRRVNAVRKAAYTVKFLVGIWIGFFILGIIHIIACVVLLVGVSGRKPKLVKVWVTVGIGTLVIFALGLLIAGIISIVYGVWIISIFPATCFLVVAVPWAGYHISVVRKYASILEDENKPMAQPTQQVSYQAEPPKEPPSARPPTEEDNQGTSSSSDEDEQPKSPSTEEDNQRGKPPTEEDNQRRKPSIEEDNQRRKPSIEEDNQRGKPPTEDDNQRRKPSIEEDKQHKRSSTEEDNQRRRSSTEEDKQRRRSSTEGDNRRQRYPLRK